MKKRLFASVGLSLLALNVFGSAAYATENQEGLKADVDVQFKEGQLKLVEASNISFGATTLKNDHSTISARNDTKHYVRVSDARGTKQGWSLGVSLSSLVGENGNKLRGAQLRLINATIAPVGAYKPTKQEIPTALDNAPEELGNSTILSPEGPLSTVVSANKGQGNGTFDLVYQSHGTYAKAGVNNTVQLYVPAGSAEAQSYKGHLNWVLANAPA